MATSSSPSNPEKVLIAAATMCAEPSDDGPLSASDLILAAWRLYPDAFCLDEHPEHPDANKVMTQVMGQRGIVARGWLKKEGNKMYSLTDEGVRVAGKLMGPPDKAGVRDCKILVLPKDEDELLCRLFQLTVYDHFLYGTQEEITFLEACTFWRSGVDKADSPIDLALDHTKAFVEGIRDRIGSQSITLSNGRSVSAIDMDMLCTAHNVMLKKFSKHLKVMRNKGQ